MDVCCTENEPNACLGYMPSAVNLLQEGCRSIGPVLPELLRGHDQSFPQPATKCLQKHTRLKAENEDVLSRATAGMATRTSTAELGFCHAAYICLRVSYGLGLQLAGVQRRRPGRLPGPGILSACSRSPTLSRIHGDTVVTVGWIRTACLDFICCKYRGPCTPETSTALSTLAEEALPSGTAHTRITQGGSNIGTSKDCCTKCRTCRLLHRWTRTGHLFARRSALRRSVMILSQSAETEALTSSPLRRDAAAEATCFG